MTTPARPTAAVRGHLPTYLVCGLLIAAGVVLSQSAVHWRQNIVDSHLFAYHGWCVSQGAAPYIDIWDNKPPGIWWVNAAGFGLCGEGIAGEILICSVALTLSLAAFAAIARAAYHPSLTILATLTGCIVLPHLIYEGGANRTETFVVACEALAVLGYLRWLRGRRWAWLVFAGLAAGTAPLFKQSGIAAGAACALHLAWLQFGPRRDARIGVGPWLKAGAAVVVVPVVVAAVLAAQGALGEAWYAVGPFNRAYFAINDATYVRIDRALKIYWEVLTPLRWLFAAAAIGLLWAIVRRFRARPGAPADRTYVELLWVWFLLAVYLACVGPGRRGHHFMPVLPSLALLALYPLHALAAGRGLYQRVVAHPSAATVMVVFGYVLALLFARNVVESERCWREKPGWYAFSYTEPTGEQLRAAEIRRLTDPDDSIYVWGWSPGTYRYAYRPCPSRFATFEKVGQLGAHAEFILDAAIEDIRQKPPEVIVFSTNDLNGLRTADPHGDFTDWLFERYEDRGIVAGMHIMTPQRGSP